MLFQRARKNVGFSKEKWRKTLKSEEHMNKFLIQFNAIVSFEGENLKSQVIFDWIV